MQVRDVIEPPVIWLVPVERIYFSAGSDTAPVTAVDETKNVPPILINAGKGIVVKPAVLVGWA